MEAPKFNLNAGNLGFKSQDELDAKVNEKAGGKGFPKGNYDLQIVSADFHKNKDTQEIYCAGDPTWFNVVVTLEGTEGRTIKHWVQVPTSDIHFGKKRTLMVYKKFTEFMASIGVPVTLENLGKVIPQYFSAPGDKLPGLKLNCDIGYEGPYAERGDDGQYLVIKGGKALEDADGVIKFPDFASAKAWAQGERIELSFTSIVKFTAMKTAPKADDSGW